MTSPNVGTQDNSLNAVAVVSATDIWAVGIYTDETLSLQYTLTEHWNGKQWSVVASPSPGVYDNELSGVTAFSSKNIWAVGYTSPVGPEETLIEHWDGTVWSIVSSPSPGNGLNQLFGVAKIPGTNHVWAVGSFNNTNSGTLSLIERWNGTKWSVIPNPDPGSSNTALYGVVALAKNDAWAVGYTANANNKSKTLTEHWDGTQWSVVPSPSITSENNLLVSVASVAGTTQLWTAGGSFSGTGTGETLTELYC